MHRNKYIRIHTEHLHWFYHLNWVLQYLWVSSLWFSSSPAGFILMFGSHVLKPLLICLLFARRTLNTANSSHIYCLLPPDCYHRCRPSGSRHAFTHAHDFSHQGDTVPGVWAWHLWSDNLRKQCYPSGFNKQIYQHPYILSDYLPSLPLPFQPRHHKNCGVHSSLKRAIPLLPHLLPITYTFHYCLPSFTACGSDLDF